MWLSALYFLLAVLAFLVSIFAVYVALGYILSMIPRHKSFQEGELGATIYLHSNGVHTDFILPVSHPVVDWWQFLNKADYPADTQYLGIGWGDRGFYLDTPTWAELKFKTAFNAMVVPSPTLMHITAHSKLPVDGKKFTQVALSAQQYAALCNYIKATFYKDAKGQIDLLQGCGYAENDQFYSAEGRYTGLRTCNQWVNKGLNQIGVRSALWTISDRGIFYQLDRRRPSTTTATLLNA